MLSTLIIEQGLVKELPKGTKLYRARKVDDVKTEYKFADITSQPDNLAFPNRINPTESPPTHSFVEVSFSNEA